MGQTYVEERKQCEDAADRFENTGDVATNGGLLTATEAEGSKEEIFPIEPPEGVQPCQHLSYACETDFGVLASRIMRK